MGSNRDAYTVVINASFSFSGDAFGSIILFAAIFCLHEFSQVIPNFSFRNGATFCSFLNEIMGVWNVKEFTSDQP